MSDFEQTNKSFDLDLEADIQNLFQEEEVVEVPQEPVLPADQLQSLVCGEEQLYTVSQLVECVELPSPGPESPSPRSAEVEEALQPTPIKSWAQDVEDEEMALLESQEDSEVQPGRRDHSLLHAAVETSQEVSTDRVKLVLHQSEPRVQDLVLEAQAGRVSRLP